jgi:diaminohydroxyphosphoribosylaminopyrimidine deaminase/5-amino-6-(5-phosphoribosylamino)uracil reductase
MEEGGCVSRRADDNVSEERRAENWMERAVSLTGATQPHPNPRVGAIVLSPEGLLLAECAHQGSGSAHAESAALAEAGAAARGGTLVVTLEPCAHHGRTPPCADAIIAAGIERVVVGVLDPDERVAGAGVERLRTAGLDVQVGIGAAAVVAADPGYFHHRSSGRPRVTLKLAITLDGQAGARDHTSQWITSEAARLDGHELRASSDAIMVGAGTLRDDDPALTVRIDGYTGRQPRPVIVSGNRAIPADAALMARRPIVLVDDEAVPLPDGCEVVVVPAPDGVDLDAGMKHLGALGIVDLLVEGGPTLAASLVRGGLVDRLVVYLGGKLAVGTGLPAFSGVFRTIEDARPIRIDAVRSIGSDVRIDAAFEEPV